MARYAVVDLIDAFADGGIELCERKERSLTELCDDPSSRDLYSGFYFSFVFGFSRTCREECGVVMVRHLLVRAIDIRLVEAGLGDAGFKIIAHEKRRNTAKVGEGARVCADPVG
jgi:hypothetical protein